MAARRRITLAVLAAVVACAGSYGFAATLGSGSAGLGAGDKVVASCGSGMKFAYTSAFSVGNSEYVVDGIDLSGIPAGCQDKSLSATFYDSSGTTVGSAISAVLTTSDTTQTIAIVPASNAIDASRVSGVSVVVS